MSVELIIALGSGVVTMAAGLGGIIYRLGAIHADFRRMMAMVADHETRLRAIEAGE